MTAGDNQRDEEAGVEKPVVTDKRRIDPETGRARHREEAAPQGTAEAGSAQGEPASAPADATAADGAPAGSATAEAPSAAPAEGDELAKAQAEALDLADQLARRNADVYNLQQEYNAYVRRSKNDAAGQRQAGAYDVIEALLSVLDEIELARQHGDLTGPFASIAEKLEGALAQRFSVERYGTPGEEFDPAVHEALMHTTDPEATGTTVSQVLQPGYRAGDRVLRAARVAVTSPE
ncbi:nucleotide exchange factor GrpE [Georgenia sp. AZ-5]|uniref:nucleotide exchange factor GrpE n=1 Tax=Georgenia sp. AZ-5 TaxID=3367526 RepID=UPI0037547133